MVRLRGWSRCRFLSEVRPEWHGIKRTNRRTGASAFGGRGLVEWRGKLLLPRGRFGGSPNGHGGPCPSSACEETDAEKGSGRVSCLATLLPSTISLNLGRFRSGLESVDAAGARREGLFLQPETVEGAEVEIGERIIVLLVKGEVLSVAEAPPRRKARACFCCRGSRRCRDLR